MKLTMVGTGYVGLVTGTCFADMGNDVICLDIDDKKIDNLKKGILPIFEPGLKEMVERNYKAGRLKFTTDKKYAYESSDIIFVCVGTPQRHNGDADLSFVFSVAEDIAKYMNGYKIIVDKSTVPVGTAEKVKRIILDNQKEEIDFDVVSNPEFLKEGGAIKDFKEPDRIVVGVESEKAEKMMDKLYSTVTRVGKPIMFTDIKSAELIKYASNAMLATRISFMNEISHLCEYVGADIKEVGRGMGLDSRIGPRFLQAGAGYGGSCFPKDVKALSHTLEKEGLTSNILMAVDYTNERQKRSIIQKIKKFVPKLEGKKIAVWGISFKPKTDDIREAPTLVLFEQLQGEYAKVSAYDPEALENAKKEIKDKTDIEFAEDHYNTLKGADALVIMTEWDMFRQPDFEKMKELMKSPNIIDARNIYDPEEVRELGFKYAGIGRG